MTECCYCCSKAPVLPPLDRDMRSNSVSPPPPLFQLSGWEGLVVRDCNTNTYYNVAGEGVSNIARRRKEGNTKKSIILWC